MIYSLRLKLSAWLFRMGRLTHPDITRLTKKIIEDEKQLSMFHLIVIDQDTIEKKGGA